MTTKPSFTVDRRPIKAQSFLSGNAADPLHLGRHPDFLSGGVAWVQSQLTTFLARHYQRLMLVMIQGHPQTPNILAPQELFSFANWYLPHLAPHLPDLINLPLHLRRRLEIYTGGFPYLLDSLYTPPSSAVDCANMDTDKAWNLWYLNWQHWRKMGISRVWLDAVGGTSTTNPATILRLQAKDTNLRIGGEPFPINDTGAGGGPGGRIYQIDQDRSKVMPYMWLYKSVVNFNTGSAPWFVDKARTECHVFFEFDDAPTLPQLRSLVDRGFILSSYDGVSASLDLQLLEENKRVGNIVSDKIVLTS